MASTSDYMKAAREAHRAFREKHPDWNIDAAHAKERNTVAHPPSTALRTHPLPPIPAHQRPSINDAQRGVYHLLKHVGPSTDADLVSLYPSVQRMLTRGDRYPEQQPSGVRTRRSELVHKGYIERHDVVRNKRGQKVILWRAV